MTGALDPAALRALATQLESAQAAPQMPAIGAANHFANMFSQPPKPAPPAHTGLSGLPGTTQQLEIVINQIVDRQLSEKVAVLQQHANQMIQQVQQQAQQAANSGEVLKSGMLQVLQAALPPESMTWVTEHMKGGAPGFLQFLQSETIRSVLQLGFEEYKQFLAGQKK